MHARGLASFLSVLLVTTCFRPALAGWSNDPGVNLPIAPNGNNQDAPLVVADGDGGAFFVWNEGAVIRAQHLAAQGYRDPAWPADGLVLASLPSTRWLTGVAPDGHGGFLAAWQDFRSGDWDIYVQRVGPGGDATWGANGLQVIGVAGTQENPRVCSDGSGGALVAWIDHRDLGTSGTDVYAQRVLAAGTLYWPGGAVAVCAQPGAQDRVSIVADGSAGGSCLLWRDARTGTADVYASRLDADGNHRPGWAFGGTAVCTAADAQENPVLESDGAFGLIAAWSDLRSGFQTDIFAMRLTSAGLAAPGWAVDGVNLSNDVFNQDSPAIATDGAGGAIVAWSGAQPASVDVYAQRIGAGGAPAWTPGGVPVATAPGSQYLPVVAADGTGGAVMGWLDARAGHPPGVYAQKLTASGAVEPGWPVDGRIVTRQWTQSPAMCGDGAGGGIFAWQVNAFPQFACVQRVDRWGFLGVQPRITGVDDVPGDEGGRVKLSWNRSPLDAWPANGVTQYRIFRSVPPNAAGAAVAPARTFTLAGFSPQSGEHDAWAGRVFTTLVAGTTYYWEHVAVVAAWQLPGYSYVATTEGDSVAGGNPVTLFLVRAEDTVAGRFWLSDPDSGYSVDDLPPVAPAPFTAAYQSGATHLHWQPNAEADLAHYRLHRGSSAGFVPGPGNLIAEPPDTGYVDSGPAGGWYKLFAVDSHGNASPASLLGPAATTDVPAAGAAPVLALAPPHPNPARGGTECRFALPAAGEVRLEVFDPAGRRVRQLLSAALPAGEHLARWDGRDESGSRAGSGLYFVRLESGGRHLARAVVLLGP